MNKISVVINTYNAERQLAEVLESVKNFDEVLICDMESTDSTLEIAARFGCHVVTFPKGDCVSAEPARTFGCWCSMPTKLSPTRFANTSIK